LFRRDDGSRSESYSDILGRAGRAAAFSYGVLTAFDETSTPGRAASLLNRIDFVTGVSGGRRINEF
jgi:hypothetical protein